MRVPGCDDGARPASLAAGGDVLVVLTDRHAVYQLTPLTMTLDAKIDQMLGDLPCSDQVCTHRASAA